MLFGDVSLRDETNVTEKMFDVAGGFWDGKEGFLYGPKAKLRASTAVDNVATCPNRNTLPGGIGSPGRGAL